MIADPIRLAARDSESFYSLFSANPGKVMFIENNSGNSLFYVVSSMVDRDRLHTPKLWSINTLSLSFRYRIGDMPMSRERFCDGMKELYPDHFEWLLFHPEWL